MILSTIGAFDVDPWDLVPRDVSIEDIAHSLAHQCRFGGHVRFHYSVADHSLFVARLVREEGHGPAVQLAALMHDTAETYLGDVTSPVKCHLSEYKAAELRAEAVICQALKLPRMTPALHTIIKRADNVALLTEARDLRHHAVSDEWMRGKGHIKPHPDRIRRRWLFPITRTKREFLREFERLSRERIKSAVTWAARGAAKS